MFWVKIFTEFKKGKNHKAACLVFLFFCLFFLPKPKKSIAIFNSVIIVMITTFPDFHRHASLLLRRWHVPRVVTQFQTKHLQCLMCATCVFTHSISHLLSSPLHSSHLIKKSQKAKSSNQVMAVLQYILGALSYSFSAKQSSAGPCDSQTPDMTLCSQTASLTCCSTWLQTSVASRWWRRGSDKGWIVTKAQSSRQSGFWTVLKLKSR